MIGAQLARARKGTMNQWRKNSGGQNEAEIRPAVLIFCVSALIASLWLFKSKIATQNTPRSAEPIKFIETQTAPRDLVQQRKRRKLKAQEASSQSADSDSDIDLTHARALLDDRQNWIDQPQLRRTPRSAQP